MAVSSTTSKVSYAGNGSTTVFAYTFKIFAEADLRVFIRDAAGTETLKTLTTDYTVSNVGVEGGGNVTFGTAPASGETVVIQRVVALTQGTDYVENDPFPAESHENALDRLTFITQQLQEEVDRSIKASVTNTISSTEFTVSATDRADKIFAFDTNGDLSVTQELGTFRGNWSSGTAFAVRDLVKDTSTNNIFLANTAHTSSGSQPLTTNTDSAKWDLIVDAASATSSASAAASSATDAEAAQTAAEAAQADAEAAQSAAEDAQADAEAAQSAAEDAQTAAESAQSSAESSLVDFRDTYYGSFANDSAAETYQTGTNGGTVDNGDLYFNTASNTLKIYNGSTWQDAALTTADFLTVANNLSDLDNAATARTNLGLEIGVDVQEYDEDIATVAASQGEMETGTETAIRSMSPLRVAQAIDSLSTGDPAYGLFRKAEPTEVAWTKTGNGTAETQTDIYVEVNGSILTIDSGTSIDMPSLTAGTDYAIWAETDGSLQASSNHTTPPSANARKVGGFHYAAGSNASGTSGGDTTAQINEYSFYDLKFKPSCPDPRGMTLVADAFWSDIYLTGVDHHTNGTSAYNVTIADGSSPPKVPSKFGGNGSTTYGSYKWFEACELMVSHGKRLPTQREFMALAYGTEEETSVGSDPVTTAIAAADADHTSKWGVMQSTGCMWVWGDDRAGPFAGASWNDNLEDRGEEYNAPNAVLLGGNWANGANAGSRCSLWNNSVSNSSNDIGSRGVCDHLILD